MSIEWPDTKYLNKNATEEKNDLHNEQKLLEIKSVQ
jgi:hypothetical protein